MEEEELEQLIKEQKGEVEQEAAEPEEAEPTNAEEKTFKKRYSDLRRHQQQQAEDFKKEIESLKSQLSQAAQKEMKLPKSDEDIEQWAADYPDVAAIVETIAMKKAKEQSTALEERMKAIDELQTTATKEKAEAELMRIHLTLVRYATVMSSMIGQKNSLSGYKMHCMTMTTMHVLLLELLICIRLTWASKKSLSQTKQQLNL